jgi:hypothetical protein
MPEPSALTHAEEVKPYKVVGKSEWRDGYVVHLEDAVTIVVVRISSATFHETAVGDDVFVRLEKAPPTPPLPGRPIPGPGRDSRP